MLLHPSRWRTELKTLSSWQEQVHHRDRAASLHMTGKIWKWAAALSHTECRNWKAFCRESTHTLIIISVTKWGIECNGKQTGFAREVQHRCQHLLHESAWVCDILSLRLRVDFEFCAQQPTSWVTDDNTNQMSLQKVAPITYSNVSLCVGREEPPVSMLTLKNCGSEKRLDSGVEPRTSEKKHSILDEHRTELYIK